MKAQWGTMVIIFLVGQLVCFAVLWSFVNQTPTICPTSPPVRVIHSPPTPAPTPKAKEDTVVYYENLVQEYETMVAYVMTKLRVASAEVKRQVLKRKNEKVPKVPPQHALCEANFVAATYNLWNINHPWPSRAAKIAALIKETKADIVGLQEIRRYNGENQLDILKGHLPEYKHSVYEKVQIESKGDEEGLGIISKHPILGTTSIHFGNTNRKCIQALVKTPNGLVNFFVIHLGLNDLEQCEHILLLWKFMNSFPKDTPQILVGDMNTYFDFEWPADLLTQGLTPIMMSKFNPCVSVIESAMETNQHEMKKYHILEDVWEAVYPTIPADSMMPKAGRWWAEWPVAPGHTFSNFDDQDPSRTDRIYYYSPNKRHTKICDVQLFGDTPFTEDNETYYPSDHKGVAAHFYWRQ